MHPWLRSLASILVCASPHAQTPQPYTAYPIDSLPALSGHVVPLGMDDLYRYDEARTQHLISAAYLPSCGGMITALEVSAHVSGRVPYESLRIFVGHTTATALGPVFATNLPAPTAVYSATNFSVPWTGTPTWDTILFQAPFAYDGTSNLVIEIQKVIDRPNNPARVVVSHQCVFPLRFDLPYPLYSQGQYHSGAVTAPTGTLQVASVGPLRMRMRWLGTPTLTVESDRSGIFDFRLGTTFRLHVHGTPGAAFADIIAGGLLTNPLPVPGVRGFYWLQDFILLGTGAIGAGGEGVVSIPIPNRLDLDQAHVYFQSLVATPTTQDWTNGVDAIIVRG